MKTKEFRIVEIRHPSWDASFYIEYRYLDCRRVFSKKTYCSIWRTLMLDDLNMDGNETEREARFKNIDEALSYLDRYLNPIIIHPVK